MANPRMTAEIGRVLGGRYRLVAPIGMGASAQVYLADDVRLRRRVALKMLHDALAGDAEFLRRFRAEARAAAALSHPNVMAVYDWGDDEVAFIVTEYLGGGSLRGLLDGGQLLSPSQALAVGLEATRALDYAHRRGFVHRDVKPANLLFGEEQRLRIADFGLARALAEAAWTEPQGAMLGTARYASPEQAKGEKVNGKADVYALALVLVEAVTGEVPFATDTTIGTLMARVDKQLVVPDALGPLQSILARAGHPDPEQRIDARTLAAGLLRAAKALPKPAPLPLAGALPRAGEVVADEDPTVHAPVARAAASPDLTADDLDLDPPDWVNQAEPGPTAAVGAGTAGAALAGAALAGAALAGDVLAGGDVHDDDTGRSEADLPGEAVAGDLEGADRPGALVADRDAHDAEADDGDADDGEPIGELAAIDPEPMPEAVVVPPVDASLAGAPGPIWADEPVGGAEPDPVHRVVDPTATMAARPLVGAGAPVPSAAPNGRSPLAPIPPDLDGADSHLQDDGDDGDGDDDGGRRRRRRWPWVVLVVLLLAGGGGAAAWALSDREPSVPERTVVLPVPALTDRDQAAAEAVVVAAGWEASVTTERRDGTLRGQVLGTTPPAGTRLEAGGTVELLVSAGQTEVPVPQDLAGKPLDEATAALEAAGLQGAVSSTRFDEEVAEGSVIGPVGGTPPQLERGRTVDLVVSDGPAPREVPGGLVGSTEAEASAAIQAVQLEVAVNRQYNDTVPEGQVVSQSPRPGAEVPRGSEVTIEVSRGPETVDIPDVTGAASPAEAAAILRRAGLVPGSVSGPSEGTPAGTSPSRGTTVRKGSEVDILLG